MGLELGWEDEHSFPQGLRRSSNGWEAEGSEWERDTGDLNERTKLRAIRASGGGLSPSSRVCFEQ